ncbi:MAG TPA: PQQ-binding-like beta-propeller repeat protein [Vicinamibacterales bacterium]|nr:PQQ-binding-like beta-propeller repeat protein [Vicinamibacterales bacterium]
MFKAVVLVASLLIVGADPDWSRFRGPNGTGVANTSGLPAEFGPAKNLAWKTAVPAGHSSPVLTRTQIFLTAVDGDKLLVLGLDRASGRELWRREVPRTRKGRLDGPNGPASPSPVTDGERVYAFFQDFGLVAFTADGREQWRLPLGPFNMYYGFGASPILVDGTLILPVDQDTGSYLAGVDAKTGKLRYKTDRPGVISGYSTPTVYEPKGGGKQILIPESFQLSAYDVSSGRRVWWVRGLACEMKSVLSVDGDTGYVNGWGFPQNQPGQQVPTISWEEGLKRYDKNHDGRISADEISGTDPLDRMLSPKYGFPAFDGDRSGSLDEKEWGVMRQMVASENGLLAVRLGGKGDMTDGAIKWKYQRPVPQVPSTLLYQGVLFMVNDSGILLSIDPATGAVLKQGRLKGAIDKYFASPVGADGKVFLVSQDGTVSVVDAKAQWEILSVNPLDDEVFATPAIADGRIYLRTKSALYAFARGDSR